jgi:XRE family transcriptional regulator, aerobic/anaerobic benzoate catabolism transcriptional regulator
MPATAVTTSDDEQEFLVELGRRLRDHRRRAGLTQEQLAQQAGLNRRWLGHVERGKGNTSVIKLRRVASVLGCTVADLLEGGR